MRYMGSKSKIAKHIVPIIQQYIYEYNINCYIEPFVGGANIIDKIDCTRKIGSDIHKCLIALYKNLDRLEELQDIVTKEHYTEVRECFNKNKGSFEDWYMGAIGFLASYNGRFFDGGYSGIVHTKAGIRNYYAEGKRNLLQQRESLKAIKFICGDYHIFTKAKDTVIYCDPQYQNTKGYGISQNFNNLEFWQWVRILSQKNIVLVSEQNAPDDFLCIWQQDIKRTINNSKTVKATEKLFIYKCPADGSDTHKSNNQNLK